MGQGGCGGGLPCLLCHTPLHCAPWSCRKPWSPSGKSTCPGLVPGAHPAGWAGQGDPPPFLPCPITPISLSIETANSSDIFQPLWRCWYSLGESLHITEGAQTLMSKPPCLSLQPAPPVFHTNVPPLVACFHIFFGLSLIPGWIFPAFISSPSLMIFHHLFPVVCFPSSPIILYIWIIFIWTV